MQFKLADLVFNKLQSDEMQDCILQPHTVFCLFKMMYQRPLLGFLIGLLAPLLGFCIVFLALGGDNTFSQFTSNLFRNHDFAAKVISLSLLANAIAFLIFNRSKKAFGTAKGIMYATFLYAVVIILLKFVWT